MQQLQPLFLILGYITVATVLLNFKRPNWDGAMPDFMGLFYIVFSFFKILDLKGFPDSFRIAMFFHFRVEKYKATESDLASNRSDVRYQSCCDERVADDLPMNATTRRRRFCLKPRQSAAFGDTGDRLGCNLGSCG